MMVPVYYDLARQKTKVWAILGWHKRRLNVSFQTPPTARVFDATGKPADEEVDLLYSTEEYSLVYPVFAEVLVSRILDRDEFRAHCDRYKTQSKILHNLK
jgi:hypothetical protein